MAVIRRFAVLLLAVPALLLSGCSGAAHTAPKTAADDSPYGKLDTSTPADTASTDVRPWESLVAEQVQTYSKWRTPWDRDQCTALDLESMPCGVEIMTGAVTAQTISLRMSAAVKADATGYIADAPPAEISSVWDQTKAAADAASTDGDAWSSKCAGKSSDTCSSMAATLSEDLDSLQTAFAGWEPYGVSS